MSGKVLQVERRGQVAWLTLSRPDKLNALGPEFWDGLPLAVAELDADPEVRVLVLRGAGRAFTAGIDLMSMLGTLPVDPSGGPPDGRRQAELHAFIQRLQASITCLERSRLPVIAAIHGYCLGGGIDLITACDIRLCAADATFGVRETRLAIVADVGTLQRLPPIVGPGVARELVFTGRDFGAAEAERVGLVNRVLPTPDAVFEAAQALAEEIAAQPPLVVSGAKRVMVEQERARINQSLEYVALWNTAHMVSQDLVRAVGAQGAGDPPTFEGR